MAYEEKAVSDGETIRIPEFQVEVNNRLLGFETIQFCRQDERGNDFVNVIWEDGSAVRDIAADEPLFTLKSLNSPLTIVLTLERGAHIQQLHLRGGENGSYFTPVIDAEDYSATPVTLEMIMHQLATELEMYTLVGAWQRKTVELDSGPLPAREGVASLGELLDKGVVSEEDYAAFMKWHDKIGEANTSPGLRVKKACMEAFNLEVVERNSNTKLKLVREQEGGVLVPLVQAMPQPTRRMMVEFTAKGGKTRHIHTIAPGRKLPRHPIPTLYQQGQGIDRTAYKEAQWQWLNHAMLEMPPDEPPYLHRTINHLSSASFEERLTDLAVQHVLAELDGLEERIINEAKKRAKLEIMEVAALRLGLSAEEAQRAFSKKTSYEPKSPQINGPIWQEVIAQATKELSKSLYEGRSSLDVLIDYHVQNIRADDALESERQDLLAKVADVKEQASLWLANTLEELKSRQYDPELINALRAWTSCPDSTGDRAHDGQGFNSGLLHYFEYRASAKKSGRFKYIDEPPTVDGFIAFTKRLLAELELSYLPDSSNQIAVMRDHTGQHRIYTLLPGELGELIVAYQPDDDSSPKLAAMFPHVTQQAFERMVASVLAGNDRGQVRRLSKEIKPVLLSSSIAKLALVA